MKNKFKKGQSVLVEAIVLDDEYTDYVKLGILGTEGSRIYQKSFIRNKITKDELSKFWDDVITGNRDVHKIDDIEFDKLCAIVGAK